MIVARDALTEFVLYGFFLVGIVIGYLSLKQVILVSQQGLRQPGGYWAAIIGFAVASLLVALPLTTDTFSESLFAQGLQSGESMLSYVNEAAGGCLSGDRRLAMLVLLLYAQLFGIIAIASGLYMFWFVSKRTGSPHITVGLSITRSEEHTLNSSH